MRGYTIPNRFLQSKIQLSYIERNKIECHRGIMTGWQKFLKNNRSERYEIVFSCRKIQGLYLFQESRKDLVQKQIGIFPLLQTRIAPQIREVQFG